MTDQLVSLNNGMTDEQIAAFIQNIKSYHPSDVNIAADIALALAESGYRIPYGDSYSIDVASTGGPSSLSTLLCPLYLLVAGAVVPKLAVPGRPAGGIDCLAQIEGYRSSFDVGEVERLLNKFGYVHFLGQDYFTPLDSRMFLLRQIHGAQNVPTLVAASLLSKKLAVGVRSVGLDVRVAPHGNFGTTWSEAADNARLFIRVGRRLSINAFPVLTDGRFPYQPYIGRCEALLAMSRIFQGNGSAWLSEHDLMCRNLALACVQQDKREDISKARSSDLQKFFHANLIAQGSSVDAFEKLVEVGESRHTYVLKANNDGFASFDLYGIRKVLVAWQQRGAQNGVEFPDPVGLILLKRPGEWVSKNEPLATVRIDNNSPTRVMGDLENFVSMTSNFPVGPAVQGITIDE